MSFRLGIFISGRGSNLKAALENYSTENLYVFSNKKNAHGLKWAVKRGVPVEVLKLKEKKDWLNIALRLNQLKIKKVLLLGFMKVIPSDFLESYEGEVINLHPSILPDFPGLDSIQKSLEAKKSVGVSLHHVNEKMDAGPLIFQSKLTVRKNLNFGNETLRVHALEQYIVECYMRLRGAA